eukprot:m.452974 g.452974  ORF g.452974 m.452974 type:complete len:308 (-) comp20421_c0_seq1:91-1014(-)
MRPSHRLASAGSRLLAWIIPLNVAGSGVTPSCSSSVKASPAASASPRPAATSSFDWSVDAESGVSVSFTTTDGTHTIVPMSRSENSSGRGVSIVTLADLGTNWGALAERPALSIGFGRSPLPSGRVSDGPTSSTILAGCGCGLKSSLETIARDLGESERIFSTASTAQIDGDRGDRAWLGDRGDRPDDARIPSLDEHGDRDGEDSRLIKAKRRVESFSGLTFANSARRFPEAIIVLHPKSLQFLKCHNGQDTTHRNRGPVRCRLPQQYGHGVGSLSSDHSPRTLHHPPNCSHQFEPPRHLVSDVLSV